MPRSTVNLLLAVAAAIAGVPLYFLTGMVLDHSVIRLSSDLPWLLFSGAITALIIGTCWATIWRRSICWTRRRTVVSALVFLGAWTLAGAATYALRLVFHTEEVHMFAPLAGVAVSLAAQLFVWRETPAERRQRATARAVPCPECGYNLAGLRQTACPECGTAFPVDQLARTGHDDAAA